MTTALATTTTTNSPSLEGMRIFNFDDRRKLDFEDYKLRIAKAKDVSEIVREPFLLYERDKLLIAYFHLEDDAFARPYLSGIWRSLRPTVFEAVPQADHRFPEHYRSEGLPHTSRTFAYMPRVTTRRDYCTTAKLAMEFPATHKAVTRAARVIGRYYAAINPNLYAEHRGQAERVPDDYQIEDGPFTSGIINRNNQLRYHFDRGNFEGVWSAMLGFKRDISGGYLALPEFDIAAEISDRSLFFFDGQAILHGVTPIRRMSPAAERYTIVYYSMKMMWNCEPLGTEVARIRRKRTVREYKRAGLQPAIK